MATTTPFTYNNGTYIPGTEQIGDLSIGLLSQDYASNPGGKIWWMGPDEDGVYVIGKDVPTQDHPTPLGNIGSVEFWATTTRDDSQFISITNKLGKNSFTTTSECLSWLNTNGYWSNYTNINGQTLISQSSWVMKRNASVDDVTSAQGSIFDSDRELFIAAVPSKANPAIFNNFPYLLSSSDIPLSGQTTFNPLPYAGNIYFVNEGVSGGNGQTGYLYLSHNTSSNHLYSLYGDTTYNNAAADRGIVKWNLNTRNVVDSVDFYDDFNESTQVLISTWCPGNDKVYVTGQFGMNTGSGRNEIQIFSGSSLSTNREIITSPGGIGRIYSSTDNSGKILWINGGGSSSRWYIISGSSFVHTGNVTPSTTNSMNPVSGWQAAYSKTSKKFYAMGIKPTNGNTVETAFLWVIDPFNLTDKVIEFGETDTLNQNVGGGCVWDANRNCIWTLDLDGKLFAIECGGDTIVKSNITLSKASLGNVSDPSVPMVIDTTSDYLILPNIVWDLSQIWPI
jgi:hypothetical protein